MAWALTSKMALGIENRNLVQQESKKYLKNLQLVKNILQNYESL